MTDLKSIYERIVATVEALGRSSNQVAAAAGKPDAIRNMRRNVESDKDGSVNVDTVVAIANELGVSPAWLITGQGDPGSQDIRCGTDEAPTTEEAIAVAEGAMLAAGLAPELLDELRALLRECFEEPVISSTPQSALESRRNLTRSATSKFLKQHASQISPKR